MTARYDHMTMEGAVAPRDIIGVRQEGFNGPVCPKNYVAIEIPSQPIPLVLGHRDFVAFDLLHVCQVCYV